MKKILIIATVASLLSACNNSTSEGFELTIDIPSAGNSPVKVSIEGDSIFYDFEYENFFGEVFWGTANGIKIE